MKQERLGPTTTLRLLKSRNPTVEQCALGAELLEGRL